MGKIHQLLPVLNEAENLARKVWDETKRNFTKNELWEGYDKVLFMHDDERKQEEAGAGDRRELTSTIIERIDYSLDYEERNFDAQYQREKANQMACADVVLPETGKVIPQVPVDLLIYGVKRFTLLREIISMAPTYDTTVRWEADTDAGMRGVYRSEQPVSANKTEKQKVVIEKAKATDKHPAQVELIDKDVIVGHYETSRKTGKLTPRAKHLLLGWFDGMIRAFKVAQSEANETEVPSDKIFHMIREDMEAALSKA